jgi:hypothetical protein
MKITIKVDGVEGVDAVTIFTRQDTKTDHHTCIEGGQEFVIEWADNEAATGLRFELVPWLRT